MINIIVNGNVENTEKITVLDYLAGKNINIATIVVEINGKIIQKSDFDKTFLNENDKVEIIRFIGGG